MQKMTTTTTGQTEHPQAFGGEHFFSADLNEAIEKGDENLLSRVLLQHGNQDGIHDILAQKSARLAYLDPEKTPTFSEIFLTPVIQTANGCDVIESDALNQSKLTALNAIRRWMPQNIVRIVPCMLRYDWVSCWSIKNTRECLMTITQNRASNSDVVTAAIDLPPGAPKLGFILFAAYTHKTWPNLPSSTGHSDARLKQVISKSLYTSVSTPMDEAGTHPIVLTPERMSVAMTEGLCVWLEQLNQFTGIEGWILDAFTGDLDVMKISLKLRDGGVQWTQFCVRIHQIGASGLNDLLSYLSELAPNLEQVELDAITNAANKKGLH